MTEAKKHGLKFVTTVFIITLLSSTPSLKASDWWENVKIDGDFRYRHEIIELESKNTRNRQRIRARINFDGKVSDEAKIKIGISSGSSDPVSNNQTLTDAFSSKAVVLDMAYFELSPKVTPGLKLLGGKMKNPFYLPGKSELIWDSDLRQEGMTVNYSRKFKDFSVKFIGSGQWITENSSKDDTYLAAGQAVFTYGMPDKKGHVTFGGSYYSYGNLIGRPTLYESDNGMGNTVIIAGTGENAIHYYNTDFELAEGFGEFGFKAGHIPMTLFGDFVTNTAADSLKNAWLVGIKLGKIKEIGSWDFRYLYRNVEKDAVVGIFTDSDFGGGGTDARGHEIGGSFQFMKNTIFSVTYFNNQLNLEEDTQTNYQKWQLDLIFEI